MSSNENDAVRMADAHEKSDDVACPVERIVMHDGSLYDYTNGTYCGVLIKEKVMRKLIKLQARHLEEVKRLLADEADNGNVFPSMWTLHYPEGKQTTVRFIDTSVDVYERIRYATMTNKPKHEPVVFVTDSMDKAASMADARHAELNA